MDCLCIYFVLKTSADARPPRVDTLDYVLTLENHPAGTFWTHAHFHGSTALQTAFRLRFPLIVEDDANSVLRSAEEVVVLVGWLSCYKVELVH